jgi:hypothetical protein
MRFSCPLGYQDDPIIFSVVYDNLKAVKLVIDERFERNTLCKPSFTPPELMNMSVAKWTPL